MDLQDEHLTAGLNSSPNSKKGVATSISVQEEKPLSRYEFIFDSVTAVGTVIVAVLAIFGERLRNWLSRPKISIDLDSKSPYVGDVETIPSTAASGVGEVCQRLIRLRVMNKGRLPAKAFSLQVDCVYRQKDGGTDFYKEALVPRPIPLKEVPLEDARNRMDLIPNYPLFIEIAELRMPEVLAQNNEQAPAMQARPELYIRIPHGARGEFYRAGQKKVVFPVIFYSESLRKAERWYVEIFWTGTDVAQLNDSNFSVRLINENNARSVVGGL